MQVSNSFNHAQPSFGKYEQPDHSAMTRIAIALDKIKKDEEKISLTDEFTRLVEEQKDNNDSTITISSYYDKIDSYLKVSYKAKYKEETIDSIDNFSDLVTAMKTANKFANNNHGLNSVYAESMDRIKNCWDA